MIKVGEIKSMRKRSSRAAALLLALGLCCTGLWGCAGSQSAPTATAAPAAQTETAAAPEQTETAQAEAAAAVEKEETSSADTSKVAGAGDMAAVEEVVEEGMVPVASSGLVPGTYKVKADSSSSMFRITDCELTVPEGDAVMQAFLTLSGSSYLYLFPGTAEEAAAADASEYIEAGENAEGKNTFLFPVEALDFGVPCAAFSKNKEMWYDRTLVFRADSLPLSAFREGEVLTPSGLDLDDGEYTAEVALSGGSGRASVQSPAGLTLKNSRSAEAEVTAELVWSSANYDYMLVEGEKYLPEIADGHSVFRIPVTCFDRNMAVIADTTAMSQAHEIEYSLRFDSSSLTPAE